MRYIQPFVMFGSTGKVVTPVDDESPVPAVKNFRPSNYERDFPATPEVKAAVEATVPADALVNVAGDIPKDLSNPNSSAIGSASDSDSDTNEKSTQGLSKELSPEPLQTSPSPSLDTSASVAKAKLLHPSTNPGKSTPPAVA